MISRSILLKRPSKNCNTFTDVALHYLTKTRLDGRFNRIERLIIATNPVSTGLLNRLFRAFLESNTGSECEVDIYVTNPEVEDFSVEQVIADLDESDSDSDEENSESSDSDGEAGRTMCNIMRPGWSQRPSQPSLAHAASW